MAPVILITSCYFSEFEYVAFNSDLDLLHLLPSLKLAKFIEIREEELAGKDFGNFSHR